ncbi:MAG: FlgD immunoglobulin-like domain containing protein, partial [Acidobacteriota bacterium]
DGSLLSIRLPGLNLDQQLNLLASIRLAQPEGLSLPIPIETFLVRFEAIETVRQPLETVILETRLGFTGPWLPLGVEEFLEPDGSALSRPGEHAFRFVRDVSDLDSLRSQQLRLRAIDATGREFTSQSVRFSPPSSCSGITIQGVYDRTGGVEGEPVCLDGPSTVAQVEEMLAEIGVDPELETVLWATELLEGDLDDIALFLRSSGDPDFAVPQLLRPAAVRDGVMLFLADLECELYDATLQVETLIDGEPQTLQIRDSVSLSDRCLSATAEVSIHLAESCGAEPPGRATVEVRAFGEDLDVLRIEDESGLTVWSQVAPEPERAYEVEVDFNGGEGLADGIHLWRVSVTSADGLTRGRRFELPVDRTPPSFEILFPAEGESVCAERKTSGAPFLTIDSLALDGFPGADQLMKLPAAWPDSSPLNPLWMGVFLAGETLAGDENLEAIAADTFGPVGPFELDLERLPGAVQLNTRMELVGLGGHRVCVPRSFSVDALADAISAEPRSAIFSPNGDGVRDRAAFAFEVPGEPLTVEARIEAGVLLEEPNRVPRCVTVANDPEVVATLASNFSLPGLESLEWDGTTQSGAPAPSGCYYLVFDAQDACGNPSTSRFRVAVDRTPPALQVLSPAPGPLAASFVEIAVNASDDFAFLTSDRPAVSVALSYGLGASPTEWFPLADPIWNAASLPPGEYTLRAIATDQAGNSTEQRTVVLLDPQDLFTYFEPEPVLFSPNGDGRLDVSTARFGLSRTARVELVVLRPDGGLIRTIDDRDLQRGSFLLPWDGTGDDGQPVPDGLYTLRLRGFEPGMGGTLSQEEALTVTVDAAPPAWELARPLAEGFLRAADQIEAAVTDLHLEEWIVSLSSASGAPAFEEIGRGSGPAVALPVQLAEGRYRLRLEARDLAGNRSELRVP